MDLYCELSWLPDLILCLIIELCIDNYTLGDKYTLETIFTTINIIYQVPVLNMSYIVHSFAADTRWDLTVMGYMNQSICTFFIQYMYIVQYEV